MLSSQPSTSSRLVPFLVVAAGAVCSGLVVGALYAAASWYSPLVLLNVALPIAAACMLGWAVAKAAMRRVLTSPSLVVLAALAGGAVALYVSWGVNAWFRIPGVGLDAFNPRFLRAFGRLLFATTEVTIAADAHDVSLAGWKLAALWVGEALVLIVGAAVAARQFLKSEAPPVCDQCGGWKTEKFGVLRRGMPTDIQAFASDLSAGREDSLDNLPDGSIDDDPHLRLDVVWCPACNANCQVSVAAISYSSEPAETYISRHASAPMNVVAKILSMAMAQPEQTESDAHTTNLS